MKDEVPALEKAQRLRALNEDRKELRKFNRKLGPKQFF
jgi:hypothetical protein